MVLHVLFKSATHQSNV